MTYGVPTAISTRTTSNDAARPTDASVIDDDVACLIDASTTDDDATLDDVDVADATSSTTKAVSYRSVNCP